MEALAEPTCYLAEWYLPELTEQSVDDLVARLDAAAATITEEGTPFVCSSRCLYRPMKSSTACSAPTHGTSCRGRACRPEPRTSACPSDIGTRIRAGLHP